MDDLAKYIEHTNLSPVVSINDIDHLVSEAIEHSFLGVCVPPFWVKRARRELGKQKILLVTVVGFPLGYQMTETKLEEMRLAIGNGADEIDMMWNMSSFKSDFPWTKIELAKCSKFAHDSSKILKVIIETAFLSNHEIVRACKLCADSGVDFVKTSTGFGSGGASVESVKLMRDVLPSTVGIKASGGINTRQVTKAMIDAGAERIGTSSGTDICKIQ